MVAASAIFGVASPDRSGVIRQLRTDA